jgi:hypothetical protein
VFVQIRAEQKEVAAKQGRSLSLAALAAMPYTEAAISEALRLGQVRICISRHVVHCRGVLFTLEHIEYAVAGS